MAEDFQEAKRRRFSEWRFALNFGQYEASGEQEPPANEVLIGREGQRAYLIDLLLNMGRRGAYLITGRRGAGKSSFVRHCIGEYQSEVFGRFVRSAVGRAALWDKALLVTLAVAAITGLLLLSEALSYLLHSPAFVDLANSRAVLALGHLLHPSRPYAPGAATPALLHPRSLALLCLLAVPIALLCANPLFYAKEILAAVIAAVRAEPAREDRWGGVSSLLWTVFLGWLAWLLDQRINANVTLALLFLTLGSLYALTNLLSFRHVEEQRAQHKKPKLRRLTRAFLIALPCLPYWILILRPNSRMTMPGPVPSPPPTWFLLAAGLVFIVIGTVARFSVVYRSIGTRDQPVLGGIEPATPRARRAAAKWYLALSSLSLLAALALIVFENAGWPLFLAVLLPPLALPLIPLSIAVVSTHFFRLNLPSAVALWSGNSVRPVFEPRPAYALAAKAMASVVVGVQLLHALWSLGPPPLGDTALGVFIGLRQEALWIFEMTLIVGLIYYLEYEWVVRPFAALRIDRSFTPEEPAPWADRWLHMEDERRRHTLRELAGMTLPWMVHKAWMPVFVLSVNLGFDDLDHRRVVHAMLVSLRARYHRTFLAWNSHLANLARGLAAVSLILLAIALGHRLFDLTGRDIASDEQKRLLAVQAVSGYPKPCQVFGWRQSGPGLVSLICRLPAGNELFHVLYFDLLGNRGTGPADGLLGRHLIGLLVPSRERALPTQSPWLPHNPLLARGLNFRVYNLVLLVALWILCRWLLKRLPILPYRQTLDRIDAMIDDLSARTRTRSTRSPWRIPRWVEGHLGEERTRETEQEPLDPRTLEIAFLSVLQDAQAAHITLPGAKNQRVSLPSPEITYVFDELDKLGMRPGPAESGAIGSPKEAAVLDAERLRALELHRLLAKMKNLLSSAPARFIFVGGRDLHDEWLADQTARHPQLTNIFNAEIYLPSLVTDHPLPRPQLARQAKPAHLHSRIDEFLLWQERRARILYHRWITGHWLPASALPQRDLEPEDFVPLLPSDSGLWQRRDHSQLQVVPCQPADPSFPIDPTFLGLSSSLLLDFVYFMTYRSMGNPKKLKELLASFVRPVGRLARDERWTAAFDCRHVLQFGDLERFRIQLLADIYRHVALTEEERLVYRDDKIAISIFYLADFLFKFHRRAFSWSNLERVDELIHIHHAPDLRDVLDEIIARWSERFLHSIRNGMYTFRFRSDLAREVEYLSRQSAYEMAAFNFTLDESQALKARYEGAIQKLDGKPGMNLQDLVAGLGELHEFDQEYETARLYYRRALRYLDDELVQMVSPTPASAAGRGSEAWVPTPPPIAAVLSAAAGGFDTARNFLTWGIARLRLMLQVGLTFELVQNLERAAVEYRDARTLARALILAMLGEDGPWPDQPGPQRPPGGRAQKRVHVLKNMHLLFQPIFAEAWVAEKLASGVDTSVALIERELRGIRGLLPFVRERQIHLTKDRADVRGSNFALIVAELHNKAGDLYFFKGRQSGKESEDLAKPEMTAAGRRGHEGYLLSAYYHYAMALRELARFVTHRKKSSALKFNIWKTEPRWPTIGNLGWPDFVFRSVGGTVNDLAESMLGRVSFLGLLGELTAVSSLVEPFSASLPTAPQEIHMDLLRHFDKWLEGQRVAGEAAVEPDAKIFFPSLGLSAGTLASWLGRWNGAGGNDTLLIFDELTGHKDAQRLLVSLHLALIGATHLERGGYLEDAAAELLSLGDTISQYLWWGFQLRYVSKLAASANVGSAATPPVLQEVMRTIKSGERVRSYSLYLLRLAVLALQRADVLFRRSRRAELGTAPSGDRDEGCATTPQRDSANMVGAIIPPSLLTLALSLTLLACRFETIAAAKEAGDDVAEGPQRAPAADFTTLAADIGDLIGSWTGTFLPPGKSVERMEPTIDLLRLSLVRYPYPMINRLHALKLLVDFSLLAGFEPHASGRPAWPGADALWRGRTPRRRMADLQAHVEELLALSEQFSAPLHFTPMNPGISSAMVYLGGLSVTEQAGDERRDGDCEERLRQAALRALTMSEETHTMRRAYYRSIADLFYLYDDFNDRQIHSRAAIQMAGTEMICLLRQLLREDVTGDHPRADRPS